MRTPFGFVCAALLSATVAIPASAQLHRHYRVSHWEVGFIGVSDEYSPTEADITIEYGATPIDVGTSATVRISFGRPEQQEHDISFDVQFDEVVVIDGGKRYDFERSNPNTLMLEFGFSIAHMDAPTDFGGILSQVRLSFARIDNPTTKVMAFLAEPVTSPEPSKAAPPSSGSGTFTYEGGITCSGEWANGLLHGGGRCVFPDGNTYEGNWQSGKRNGFGTATYGDGRVQAGQWRDDVFVEGRVELRDGRVYDGSWDAWGPTGSGTVTYPNGDVYSGGIKDGEHHGVGTLESNEGYTLVGGWENGKRHGETRGMLKNGTTVTGRFDQDVAEGPFTYTHRNGRIVEVVFEGGRKSSEREVRPADDFEGIGIALNLDESSGRVAVTAIGADGPAASVGLAVGDVIDTVNDQSLHGKTLDQIVALIRGPAGTTVDLGIIREGERLRVIAQRGQIDASQIDDN